RAPRMSDHWCEADLLPTCSECQSPTKADIDECAARDVLPRCINWVLICICGCHFVSGQAGAIDRLLNQSGDLCLFDKFVDVGEALVLTLPNGHTKEIGTIALVQYPRSWKFCRALH